MRIYTRRPRSSRAGSALAMALIAVMTIAAMCAALLQVSGDASSERNMSIDDLRALYVAEAGLAEAFNGLYAGKSGVVGSPEEPASYGGGVYWVEAEEQIAGVVLLQSTGLYQAGRERLQLAVELYDPTPVALGVFGEDGIELGQDSSVVVFGSDTLDYTDLKDTTSLLSGADLVGTVRALNTGIDIPSVGSNGDIVIEDGATVVADLVPGPGRVVVFGDDVFVAGTATPSEEAAELPVPAVPLMTSLGSFSMPAGLTHAIGGESFELDALVIGGRSSLTLVGPAQVVLDSLYVASDSGLAFDTTSGPVHVYVRGEVQLAAGSTVTTDTNDTSGVQLLMYGTDDPARYPDQLEADLQIDATASFYGFVYAPHSALSIPASFEVAGGAAARFLALEDGARIALDFDLCNTAAIHSDPLQPISWSIQPLPDIPLIRDRRDPFVQLAEAGITPVTTSAAHFVQGFAINYEDAAGVIRRYDGAEAMFDWDAVVVVNRIWREGEAVTPASPKLLPPDVVTEADAIKALLGPRDQTFGSGRRFWYRKRAWR